MPPAAPGASYCSGGSFCMGWSTDTTAGLAFITLSTSAGGYASIGFSDTYNAMSPADVYVAWADSSTGAVVLSHRRNANGHDPPTTQSLPTGAQGLAAVTMNGTLTVTFAIPLPASNSHAGAVVSRRRLLDSTPGGTTGTLPVNVIWSVSGVTPFSASGVLAQHGGSVGHDFGSLAVDMQCATSGGPCVLATGLLPAFNILHKIVLAGAGATIGVALLGHLVRRKSFDAEHYAQLTMAHTRLMPNRLLPSPSLAAWGPPELVIVAGYGITLALYFTKALQIYPTSAGRAIGTALGPMLAVALMPVSRRSILNSALGLSYERALLFHQAGMYAVQAVIIAHAAVNVVENGVPILLSRSENSAGKGPVYGTVAAVLMAGMAQLASPPMRRRWWKVFKASHIILFPIALIIACIHAQMLIPYILPPIILYLLDRLLATFYSARTRTGQMVVLPPGNTVRLHVHLEGTHVGPDQFAWLCVPELGHMEWHPYTMVTEWEHPNEVAFLIAHTPTNPKSFGDRLVAMCEHEGGECTVKVKVDGPYGRLPVDLHNYTAAVLIAGGVGITPFPRLTRACLDAHLGLKGRMRSVTVMWASRDPEVFTSWLPGWLPALEEHPLFKVQLYDTSSSASASKRLGSTSRGVGRVDRTSSVRSLGGISARNSVRSSVLSHSGGSSAQLAAEECLATEMHAVNTDTLGGVATTVNSGPEPPRPKSHIISARPKLGNSIQDAVQLVAACGDHPSRVLVIACGPTELIAAAQSEAASQGCHFYGPTFNL
jgi:hypothetical protein